MNLAGGLDTARDSREDQVMTNTVSRSKAEAVLKAVETKFSTWCMDFARDADGKYDFDAPLVTIEAGPGDKPTLVEDWDGNGNWAVVWEGNAPYDWAIGGIEYDYTDPEFGFKVKGQPLPKGVFCEPYYSFVLVIYPA